MSYLNQVFLIGRLGQDPHVLKKTDKGSFVKMRLCTNKMYKDVQGEKKEISHWHTIYAGNSLGKYAASTLKKGDLVLIEGQLQSREWQNKEGHKQCEVSVQANEIKNLTQKIVTTAAQDDDVHLDVDEGLAMDA